MAVKLVANYAKRLGLPGFSSHQFSVSLETELTDLSQLQGDVNRIYGILQGSVDHEIKQTGFVPDDQYGKPNGNGANWHQNGGNGNIQPTPRLNQGGHEWKCSEKQKSLILKLIKEHDLDPQDVENIALQRFGTGLAQLNKLQASGLISELIETYGNSNRNGNGHGKGQRSLPMKEGGQR